MNYKKKFVIIKSFFFKFKSNFVFIDIFTSWKILDSLSQSEINKILEIKLSFINYFSEKKDLVLLTKFYSLKFQK